MQDCPACDGGRIAQNIGTCALCGGRGRCTKAAGSAWHDERRRTRVATIATATLGLDGLLTDPKPVRRFDSTGLDIEEPPPCEYCGRLMLMGRCCAKAGTLPTFEDMLTTKREAEVRIRQDFQMRWGRFYKCVRCGARLSKTNATGGPYYCCGVPAAVVVYTS